MHLIMRRSTRIDPPGMVKGWEPGPQTIPGGKDEEDEHNYKYTKNGISKKLIFLGCFWCVFGLFLGCFWCVFIV